MQNERTTLAWIRTSLALAIAGLLGAKATDTTTGLIVVGVLTVLTVLALGVHADRAHQRRRAQLAAGRPVVEVLPLALVALVAPLLALGTAVAIVL